jgi:hypothetical protein
MERDDQGEADQGSDMTDIKDRRIHLLRDALKQIAGAEMYAADLAPAWATAALDADEHLATAIPDPIPFEQHPSCVFGSPKLTPAWYRPEHQKLEAAGPLLQACAHNGMSAAEALDELARLHEQLFAYTVSLRLAHDAPSYVINRNGPDDHCRDGDPWHPAIGSLLHKLSHRAPPADPLVVTQMAYELEPGDDGIPLAHVVRKWECRQTTPITTMQGPPAEPVTADQIADMMNELIVPMPGLQPKLATPQPEPPHAETITVHIEKIEPPADVVCKRCNDTHYVDMGERLGQQMCTACPKPCPGCKGGPSNAYCATTPCTCSCHKSTRQL